MTYSRRLGKSRLKLGLIFGGFLAGLLLLAWSWRQVAASRFPGREEFFWIEQSGDRFTVYGYLAEYGKQLALTIPGNTLVETAFGYGRYQWKNVFALGQLDGRSGDALLFTSRQVLGLPLTGWRVGRQTNLSVWDRIKWSLVALKTGQRLTLDLSRTAAWQPLATADGSQLWQVDEYQLDQLINRETFSQRLAAEGLSVSLVNDQGLSRVIKNHGIELVSVSQTETPEKTVIYLNEARARDSQTVKWLKTLLPQAEIQAGSGDSWSAIVIVLGKDYN